MGLRKRIKVFTSSHVNHNGDWEVIVLEEVLLSALFH